VYATVLNFTVDFRGDDFDTAQTAFERAVVPEMRKQNGYEGCYVLRTPKGSGMLVMLWEDRASAIAAERSGPFAEQMQALIPLLGETSADAQRYDVAFADHPVEPD
jgi:heme-degrading monooxygenase HmoA